ncbi:hypothetical protein MGYG_06854 [Nannizzia gypsea CBS 118893]|uniref:F-box domain-containing protein n=1 Tax=Arthroderma gypseum (strain ATCC MYA-4604 / CBS 118893) TaxID=535722 RepID=E4V1D9_ARTGP|nr:hypothetical protein MGYG_06854 [Nannizzia gypsea CBS 118893]EFR03854.1 hypothetical protein MGYG_06854 [Nannizzia gypsea CBS 118893]
MARSCIPRSKQRLNSIPGQKKIPPPCSALTHSFGACKNRASTARTLHKLPLCWAHRKLGQAITSCQARLKDDRKCLKKIPWSERRQLCIKHADYSLPCYILRLPTELRQQIFSYILDDYQSQYVQFYTYYSFLKIAQLNRQIFREATDILYRNLVCKVFLYEGTVCILGRNCLSVKPGSWQYFKQFHIQLRVADRHEATLNNTKLIATQLRDRNIKLHVEVLGIAYWYSCRTAYIVMPSFLDTFRQLRRVRETRVTMDHELAIKSIEYRGYKREQEELVALISQWESYSKEWIEDLERGHSAEGSDSKITLLKSPKKEELVNPI